MCLCLCACVFVCLGVYKCVSVRVREVRDVWVHEVRYVFVCVCVCV